MRLLKLLFFIVVMSVVAITGALFVIDNPTLVDINFYKWQLPNISVPLLSLFVFAVGLLTGAFATVIRVIALQSKLALVKRQLKQVEKERDKLRLLGIKE
ncbi:LapA family protein [Litoribacillus peritrichatus]|uniref:Lipopolysaccharide assembly protein A domain-containing protein n=1 Tax=Litoribacillus peritrichatus TaxID=718191 RepID=A0ABP7M4M4_9GAMM